MSGFKKPIYKYFMVVLLLYTLLKLHESLPRKRMDEKIKNIDKFKVKENKNRNMEPKLKYVLQWTFPYLGADQQEFKDIHCAYTNCFITVNRSYLGDYTKFDVIVFAGPEVVQMSLNDLPKKRSAYQKYVFASEHSADKYPVCSNRFNGYFNWTWTYRLESDASLGYIIVADSEKQTIGPKNNIDWIKLEDMKPISKKLRDKLQKKSKAAVWFQTNCHARSRSANYVKKLQKELKKFDLIVDIYTGNSLSCPLKNRLKCNKMIETEYFFYLSFENYFAEDYVTEQLLYGLQNLAVPIVYGGANYTRFMADGSYINARDLTPKMLAEKMNKLIKNQGEYSTYFKWSNYYSYYKRINTFDNNRYCRFCFLLNDEEAIKKTTVYKNFREWWDPPGLC